MRLFAPKTVAPEPTPEPVVQAPQGVTKDDLKTLLEGAMGGVTAAITPVLGQLQQGMAQLAERQPQVIVQGQPTPQAPQITDEEIDNALLTGQGGAARIRALVDRAVNVAAERIVREHVQPLQDTGLSSLSALAHKVGLSGLQHYPRYRKEIDQRVNALDPSLRANPDALSLIYNAVVGEHANDLAREAAEEAVRKAQEPAPEVQHARSARPGTGAGAGGHREEPALQSAEDVGGADGMAALAHKGNGQGNVTQDAFAQSMGYANWQSYMKQYEDLLNADPRGNA